MINQLQLYLMKALQWTGVGALRMPEAASPAIEMPAVLT
jgi:hypothetical protein